MPIMEEATYTVSLEVAESCLSWIDTMYRFDEVPDDLPEVIVKAVSEFKHFLNLVIKAEIESITIPEHHRMIYDSVCLHCLSTMKPSGAELYVMMKMIKNKK